jgi:DNA-binding transcriptional LysR family regulator
LREQGSGTLSAFEAALTANGISMGALDIALTLPSSEAVRSAIMAGPFATVVSELVVASHLQAGALVRANFKLPPRAFYLLRHTERYKSMASLALERLIDTAVA